MASERANKLYSQLFGICEDPEYSLFLTVINTALQEEREQAALEAAEVARKCMNFTGAGYCDVMNPANKGKQMHDYGRGGYDAQRVIVRDICLHFNLDEDLDAAMEATKNG